MIKVHYYNSPVGQLRLVSEFETIIALNFNTGKEIDTAAQAAPDGVLEQAVSELTEYFDGKRKSFEFKIQDFGTEFQKLVWNMLLTIPYGETWTYGELAKKIGKPAAARAVGGALNRNPLGIVVPCHRVIGSNKSLTGFAGGVHVKQQLLDLEKKFK